MLYAVIDVGSNSVRLSVYQCENGNIQPLIDKKDTVGLAGYVENGIMVEEGMKKAAGQKIPPPKGRTGRNPSGQTVQNRVGHMEWG